MTISANSTRRKVDLSGLSAAEYKRLSKPIFYVGGQWAITKYGVEALDGKYFFAKDRLTQGDGVHDWLDQLRAKGWCNMVDFHQAFAFARRHYLGIATRPLSRTQACNVLPAIAHGREVA